jgi:(R,R)-butanediol dehydrogenase / meso-butanediol dehydrogenase / diacetyl reductase
MASLTKDYTGGKSVKAAVFHAPQDFAIEDVPYPRLERDGVIIKVRDCGICGSDLHFYHQSMKGRAILGHEFSGDVVEIGAEVNGVARGDRVVACAGRGCGKCWWCQHGDYIHCSKLGFVGYAIQGAFAEYVSVPAFSMDKYAAKLPASLTYEDGATAEPLAVALYAVNQMDPQADDTVVVIGLGIIGICIVQILKSLGVKQIIASGRRSERLQAARSGGADIVVDAAREDLVSVVKELNSGKGADIVFECAGNAASFEQAMHITHRGGKIDIVGLYEQPFSWNPSSIATTDITLVGCGLRWDLPGAAALMQQGKVNTRPLVTHRFPLERIREGFETQANDKSAIKVMIKVQP